MFLLLAQVSDTVADARNLFAENLTLVIALGLTALVMWWIFKKIFKLALYAGVAGLIAWVW
ncbi:MAG: hypothetical protein OEM97_11590, partial [Acidimicrobiia bacterium]|nr:hypothetical protein [Acidimicrobiia bacterium]